MREPQVHDTTSQPRRVGRGEVAVTEVGATTITREVAPPGWRWSHDIKPIVGTDFCRAFHQLFIVSGQLHVMMEDGAELDVHAGDAAVIPPGHDAWVVGDEPCDMLDFSPEYLQLIEAGETYQTLTAAGAGAAGDRCSRAQAARRLRADVAAGRLDASAVELVLGAVGHRPRGRGPAGLTPREVEVLVLIATGASAKQVAYALGIAPKTAETHIERIYVKCGVSTRSDATRFAIAQGLVDLVPPRNR